MSDLRIGAVVLAAGRSQRMGRPKMTLPWGETTVIGQVIHVLSQAGLSEIVVITGGAHREVSQALKGSGVRLVYNRRFRQDVMAYSLQMGLLSLPEACPAALVALGDQPQIQEAVVRSVIETYYAQQAALVAPSFQNRRGHPWLVSRTLWPEILALQPPLTLRNFFARYTAQTRYVVVQTDSVLRDLDTPEDYLQERPPSA